MPALPDITELHRSRSSRSRMYLKLLKEGRIKNPDGALKIRRPSGLGVRLPLPAPIQPTERTSVRKDYSSRGTLFCCTIFGHFCSNRARTAFLRTPLILAEQPLLHRRFAALPV